MTNNSTIQIKVRLHGRLRDVLPRELKGRTMLEMPALTTVSDIVAKLGLSNRQIIAAVNDEHESDDNMELVDGDNLHFFAIAAGG